MRDVRAHKLACRGEERETTPLFQPDTFQCCCVIVKAALSHMITRLTKLIRQQHESRKKKKKDNECTHERARCMEAPTHPLVGPHHSHLARLFILLQKFPS